jgi:hypothetical protein
MNEDEWITDYIFSHQKTGVRPRELVQKSKMWGFNPKYIAKYIKDMIRAERLLKIKGKLFPSHDEHQRIFNKMMYARRQKIARELLRVARELLKEGR